MIQLKGINTTELAQELIDRKRDISVEIVTNILYAIENNLDTVMVDVISPMGILISIDSDKYIDTLTHNYKTLIEYEEYELLHMIKLLKK